MKLDVKYLSVISAEIIQSYNYIASYAKPGEYTEDVLYVFCFFTIQNVYEFHLDIKRY